MGGELPEDVPQDISHDIDPPYRYDICDDSTVTTDYSSYRSDPTDIALSRQTTQVDPSFISLLDSDYNVNAGSVNAGAHLPLLFETPDFDGPQANEFAFGPSSTHNDGTSHHPMPWMETNTVQDLSHMFTDLQPASSTVNCDTLWPALSTNLDNFDFDVFLSDGVPNVAQFKGVREAEGPVADALVCDHEGCDATFTGKYRRGNKARHMKIKHHSPNGLVFPCEHDYCHEAFGRQDARLQHYRKHHPHLAPAQRVARGPRNREVQENARETNAFEGDGNDRVSIIELNFSGYPDLIMDMGKEKDSSSYTTSGLYNTPPRKFRSQHAKTGCLTCRRRRVKCGEERPTCKNCITSARVCEDYHRRTDSRTPFKTPPNHLDYCSITQMQDQTSTILGHPPYKQLTLDAGNFTAPSVLSDDIRVTDDGRFKCSLCEDSSTFQRLADVRRHMHQKHEEPTYDCGVPGCGRKFHRMDKLRDHVRLAHKGDVGTTEDGIFHFHVAADSEGVARSHRCPQCREDFQRKCDLNHHIHRKHERRYMCTFEGCTKAFNLNTDLERHISSVHRGGTNMPTFVCSNVGCERVFSRKDNLARHMRSCQGEQTVGEAAAPATEGSSTENVHIAK
jgi:hypothetical protein